MAARMSRIESLRLAKIVPDVSENCASQPLHLKILRALNSYTVTQPHFGQNGAPPFLEKRIALKAS